MGFESTYKTVLLGFVSFSTGFALLLSPSVTLAGDAEAGQAYFQKVCAACHGKTAKGMASFPSLQDRSAGYISERLHTYRDRGVVGPNSALMYAHAGKLDDADIANIAAYLETAFGAPESSEAATETVTQTDTLSCSQQLGEQLGRCGFKVSEKDSQTVVSVTFASGFTRDLKFVDDEFVGASTTMSGTGSDFEWNLVGGDYHIQVDDQRFVIPETVISVAVALRDTDKGANSTDDSLQDDGAVDVLTADIDAGERKFMRTCRGCHGPKAQGLASYPGLAGKTPEYLVQRLEQYRAGEKLGPNTPLMAPNARNLTDQDITNIVGFIGTL